MKDFSKQRLRTLLTVFFLALTIPTSILIVQAYNQLKWEAFYQYRGMAEEMTSRIDATFSGQLNNAEVRNFTDYAFLIVSGDPAANFLQRSPLSDYPVTQDVPGVIGYFQVGTNGEFSTPLLPDAGTPPEKVGISPDEYAQRLQRAQEIQQVLANNQLVRSRVDAARRRAAPAKPESAVAALEETEAIFDDDKDVGEEIAAQSPGYPADDIVSYSQQAFDRLNQPSELLQTTGSGAGALKSEAEIDSDTGVDERVFNESLSMAIPKVADIKLDHALQKKSEALERKETESRRQIADRPSPPARSKRIEQSALPEILLQPASEAIGGKAGLAGRRISTFETEVDPYEFSMLDSGHLVLFRKVWRDGERYIQGLLIDPKQFLNKLIVETFHSTSLATMSSLAVAYQNNIITAITGRLNSGYPSSAAELDGTLLYQSHLAAPLGGLQLIFSIDRLPPGPGASVLGWTTMVIAIVFLGGFFGLYRIGLSQINLATQQQDFVSAVSHELKTPLTSIRMYGEMLKEGWADEEKRQQYYGYIHDESERLSRLITNVLQLAKITRNEPQFDMAPRVVGELMSRIEAKILTQVESAGFELAFEHDANTDKSMLNIDEDCFAQIIINLVDNAIKFSKDASKKRIEIACAMASDNTMNFSVRDYGPGIPRNQMKKIFGLFYRSESELTRETVGTGIGLAIVHQLTTAMHGKVDVVNKNPGVEFELSFPIE